MSKPQRRRGNAQSASSAKAADLLGASGFVGFDIGWLLSVVLALIF